MALEFSSLCVERTCVEYLSTCGPESAPSTVPREIHVGSGVGLVHPDLYYSSSRQFALRLNSIALLNFLEGEFSD